MTLKKTIQLAESEKRAIGHFNISNLEALWAIARAAKEVGVPVVIGVSEGEREFMGVNQVKALVDSVKKELDHPIFLNADHTYSLETAKPVIDAGYDSLVFDAAKLPLEENIQKTKEVVDYARSTRPDMLLEAELGYIGTSSKLLDEIPEGASVGAEMMVKPNDAKNYVQATGIDLLAPAVGNIHGMLKNVSNPKIDPDRVKEIRAAAGVPLVLHGGSGITNDNFKEAIAAGISMIHINTEIRKAWADAVANFISKNPDEVAPYKIMKDSVTAVQTVVSERLKLFSNL